ncbi:3-methyl-2-oxobutanoate hydroxymethyltransferase [Nitratiruptor sp. SB155-2]|uniref:3-methyl-2-oxobutanoate hydroxymethyltransferase n=1 Tax=Nitratiruptor sp. (strain SB155-2) TaxID=387092 RepID=PANB_NITSB|nr:3-methyl-2-oxobutanoate hydroxymethyltransferase [Nitratiruptor sp. SB155-2]A6Q1X8.1 RecName: Full=3-methyl-2-oxobutanoate hydroxymethyltransferase; AltName: Full=Ketopantoate hydroxymethyltransferase; Short=KPHMT [Nitratiruptor sp. SB155-2]BAF69487.1 3-methyl-2-oxobutanoate hydroxymethyltransferase [Nitratiruptor sp. SB155-2]
MKKRHTVNTIKSAKNSNKLVMITAYDALFAKLFEPIVDMILVGDSLNMVFAGRSDTLSATLDQMIYHANAVCSGAPSAFVVLDMPYGTYINEKEALQNAIRIYKETDVDAVKLEGGKEKADLIKTLCQNGIAVMGHIGLLPQHVRGQGGYKVVREADRLMEDAKALEEAGVFSIIIEGVKPEVAAKVTDAVQVPVIGIGAGKETDGQVLVWSDMLGFFEDFKPKFVKQYLNGAKLVKEAVSQYAKEVKEGSFPSQEFSY